MLEFTAPLWLSGLLSLPLVRWLHRFRAVEQVQVVSALFLWRRASQEPQGAAAHLKPHPIWWLRAAIVAVLLAALAGPQWRGVGGVPVVVWMDDSLSMFAQDTGGRRIELGIRSLLAHLDEARAQAVTLRSLGEPHAVLRLTDMPPSARAQGMQQWLTAPRGEPAPPLARAMPEDVEHWVVSDGAAEALTDWLGGAPVGRVIQVGHETENSAVTGLAMRPEPGLGNETVGTVTVAHLGVRPTHRVLEVMAGDRLVGRWPVNLGPGDRVTRDFRLPDSSRLDVKARIHPPDALAQDDELNLQRMAAIRARLAGDCGPHLRAALVSYPYLRVSPDSEHPADVTIGCGASPPGAEPLLRVSTDGPTGRLNGVPYWHADSGWLQEVALAPEWLKPIAHTDVPAGMALLSAGGHALITLRSTPRRTLHVGFDLEARELVQDPRYPVLVAGLLERLLGRELSLGLASAERDPGPSLIQPGALTVPPQSQLFAKSPGQVELGSWLLVAALGLIALDAGWVLGVRAAWRRLWPGRSPGHVLRATPDAPSSDIPVRHAG